MTEATGHETTGTELVQAAALEAIKAMRALLDIAETVVREPGTAAVVGRAFAEAAASAFRPSTLGDEAGRPDDDNDDKESPGRVRRIHLTE